MSKSSRDTLFGITLTEIVIILFFIMLLLALLNQQEKQDELNSQQILLDQKILIIEELNSDALETGETSIEWIMSALEIEESRRSDLYPLQDIQDEIDRLLDLKTDHMVLEEYSKLQDEELTDLAEENQSLKDSLDEVSEELDQVSDQANKNKSELEELMEKNKADLAKNNDKDRMNGDGDCKDGGYWIQSKCADYCWETTANNSSRKYDYLLDVGVCKSNVIVQKSNWLEKTDEDFSAVIGAEAAVAKRIMTPSELYRSLATISKPGYEKKPKQCFHSIRLINLGASSIPYWETLDKEVGNRVGRQILTSADKGFLNARSNFSDDICDEVDTSLKPKSIDETEMSTQPETMQPIPIAQSLLIAKPNQRSFAGKLLNVCRRSSSNSEFTATFTTIFDDRGRADQVIFLRANKVLGSRDKNALSKVTKALEQTKYDSITGESLSNKETEFMVKISKNICSG